MGQEPAYKAVVTASLKGLRCCKTYVYRISDLFEVSHPFAWHRTFECSHIETKDNLVSFNINPIDAHSFYGLGFRNSGDDA